LESVVLGKWSYLRLEDYVEGKDNNEEECEINYEIASDFENIIVV
jgi:hypothetical protein